MVLVEIVTAVPLPYEVTPNLKGVWKWNLKGLDFIEVRVYEEYITRRDLSHNPQQPLK